MLLCVACNAFDPTLLGRPKDPPDAGASSMDAGPVLDAGHADGGDGGDSGDGCVDGGCGIACDDGLLDCDGLPESGCEVDATRDPAHCGSCDRDCAEVLQNAAETACLGDGLCAMVSCAEGFSSCDGDPSTGCETSTYTTTDCGGCASTQDNQPCSTLAHAMGTSCPVGSCEIDACDSGWANCDGDVGTGCEHDVGALGPCTPKLMRITIDAAYVDATLADFPVLVRIVDSELMTARSDGLDLLFSADGGLGGGSALPFEIESWSRAEGALIAWVRLSSVSSSADTVFYLRYGDGLDRSSGNSPRDVWDASFASVQHFNDSLDESSANDLVGTDHGSNHDAAGQIAGARAFAATTYVDMGQGVLPSGTAFTLSAWVKVVLSGGAAQKYVMDSSEAGSPYNGMALGLQQSDGAVGAYVGGDWRFSTSDFVAADTWALIAVRYDVRDVDGRFESSVDGEPFELVFTGNTLDAQNVAGSPFQVGRWAGDNFHFDGSIDELRVSSTARSDAWMRATYENQRSGSTFLTVAVAPP